MLPAGRVGVGAIGDRPACVGEVNPIAGGQRRREAQGSVVRWQDISGRLCPEQGTIAATVGFDLEAAGPAGLYRNNNGVGCRNHRRPVVDKEVARGVLRHQVNRSLPTNGLQGLRGHTGDGRVLRVAGVVPPEVIRTRMSWQEEDGGQHGRDDVVRHGPAPLTGRTNNRLNLPRRPPECHQESGRIRGQGQAARPVRRAALARVPLPQHRLDPLRDRVSRAASNRPSLYLAGSAGCPVGSDAVLDVRGEHSRRGGSAQASSRGLAKR